MSLHASKRLALMLANHIELINLRGDKAVPVFRHDVEICLASRLSNNSVVMAQESG
jgi:hypothetical protein